jgi:hypothetical protein
MRKMRNAYVLVGKCKGKSPLGRYRRRWKNNIKMDLKETGCEGVYRIQLAFLTSALDGGEWSASRPVRFTPRENPDTHWLGGWVDSRASLDTVVKRKILSPCRDSNPRSSSP